MQRLQAATLSVVSIVTLGATVAPPDSVRERVTPECSPLSARAQQAAALPQEPCDDDDSFQEMLVPSGSRLPLAERRSATVTAAAWYRARRILLLNAPKNGPPTP